MLHGDVLRPDSIQEVLLRPVLGGEHGDRGAHPGASLLGRIGYEVEAGRGVRCERKFCELVEGQPVCFR
jgi:hypothetical protein